MKVLSKIAILLFCWLIVPAANAHEIRPSYLEIIQTETEHYNVTWKQPVSARGKLDIYPVFPEQCDEGKRQVRLVKSAIIENFTVTCELQNQSIEIRGLDRTLTDVFVRFVSLDGNLQIRVLHPSSRVMVLENTESSGVSGYLAVGVEHILSGWDHLLFVFALILLVRPAQILACVTAFTIAHSLTLGLSALGHISLPATAVEITVALSITLMGLEILKQTKGHNSLTARLGWPVTVLIGLVHGFGFAGALIEIGLPEQSKLLALLFFNLGVEIGQLAVIGVLLLSGWILFRINSEVQLHTKVIGAYCAGIAGTYWAIERTWSVFNL